MAAAPGLRIKNAPPPSMFYSEFGKGSFGKSDDILRRISIDELLGPTTEGSI